MQAQGLGGHTSPLRPWIIAGVANMKPWEEDQEQQGGLLGAWIHQHISGVGGWGMEGSGQRGSQGS